MTRLVWTDPETGEDCEHDVSGWQIVIDTASGEIMRADFVALVLTTAMRTAMGAPGPFSKSLLALEGGHPFVGPDGWWIDMKIERR